jgi:hypothetical protein
MMRKALVQVLLLLAGPVFAANALEGPAELETELQPKGIEELCVELAAGETVGYWFESSAPLDFNVHWHRGKQVHYPVKRDRVRRLEGRFRAREAQTYCLMWTSRAAKPLTLRARVERRP